MDRVHRVLILKYILLLLLIYLPCLDFQSGFSTQKKNHPLLIWMLLDCIFAGFYALLLPLKLVSSLMKFSFEKI